MTRIGWIAVALVFAGRLGAAFAVPLTGDEAYYWEWSKRLAFGYADHPPAVAWTICLFSWLGHGAGFVRLGFVACGAVATLAVAWCAALVGDGRRAGLAAALAFTFAPLTTVAFVVASPDGPFLACWALALLFAVRLQRFGNSGDAVALGLALGGVLLSRLFGFALLAGLVAYVASPAGKALRRPRFAVSLAIAAVVYAPFVAWNAQHQWITFAFSLIYRHEGEGGAGFSLGRFAAFLGTQALAYSPGLWLAAVVAAARSRVALALWTGVPLGALLAAFVLFRQVEVNWTLGVYASLCVAAGVTFVRLRAPARTTWAALAIAPAALLLAIVFVAALVPGPSYALVARATGHTLRNAGPFEVFAFRPLAHDVARQIAGSGAVAMTDGYGFSSVLDYEAGLTPVVIGYDWQGRESHAWYPSSMRPTRALFVDKEPLATRPDFRLHLGRACARTVDAGSRAYRYGDAPPRRFYFTWCEGLRPDGLAILRWQREPG